MPIILSIETSVPNASIVLNHNGITIYQEEFTTDRKHNSMIFTALDRAIAHLNGKPLSLVIVGTGPGSYSGTRVGIAAGQGIAIAHECPTVGINSLAATCDVRKAVLNSPKDRQHDPAIAIGDARRGLYYFSSILKNGEATTPELMNKKDLADRLIDKNIQEHQTHLFTFDSPEKIPLPQSLKGQLKTAFPEASHLVDIWLNLDETRKSQLIKTPLTPTYLRPPFTSKAKEGHPLLRN